MPDSPSNGVRAALDRLYARYNRRSFVPPDPLQFVYRYPDPRDAEIAGFLAAALAYGRVRQIERSLTELFDRMDGAPYEFTARLNGCGHARLRGFKHRFTTGDDIADLLMLFRRVLDEHGSLEAFFATGCRREDATVLPALSRFCDSLAQMHAKRWKGRNGGGLNYLLASPSRGSASKRLHLFLRWMVRRDAVDVGFWTCVDKAKLIVPVDVHMGRLTRILGFHDVKSTNRTTAVRITDAFRRIAPDDPAKFDFALSRIGILEDCTGRRRPECHDCELDEICLKREKERT